MFRKLLTFACLSLGLSQLTPFSSLNGVGVQLFQWKFTDIASECTFLANNGYSYVQTSPVQEHIYNIGHPIYDTYWYHSYAPIGYNIGNRLGSLTEFQLMVSTCNSLGVAVVVDVVLRHQNVQNKTPLQNHRLPVSVRLLLRPLYLFLLC